MKSKLSWLVSLLILIFSISIAVLIFEHRGVIAKSTSDFTQPQIQEPSSTNDTQQGNLLEETLTKINNWSDNIKKSGWVHTIVKQSLESNTSNIAPDGSIALNNFITEEWVHLDENGYQIEGIFLQRSEDGEIFQVSILKDNMWHNLTYGDLIPAPEKMPYPFDFDIPSLILRLNGNLTKESIEINGENLEKISTEEIYQEPFEVLDFDKRITSLKFEIVLNKDGMLKTYQTIVFFEDGSSVLSSSIEVLFFEQGIEPPEDIRKYLEKGEK